MTFDEQLQRTLDTFSSRLREEVADQLRDEVARQVRVVNDELAVARAEQETAVVRAEREAAVRAEQEQEAAVVRAEREAAARVEREAAVARAEREATERAEQEAAERADRAAAERTDRAAVERGQVTGRLAEGICALGAGRLLSEVLDTLVRCAGQEAARAGVLLVRGDRFHGWRFQGFDPSQAIDDRLDIAHGYAGVIAQALQSAAAASSTGGDAAPVFAQLKPGQACGAVPIVVGGEVVAILYADAGSGSVALDLEPLEILTRFASQRLEALTAIKAARSVTASSDLPPSAAPARTGESADQHAAARRYARLLVSEIKLYHAPQVAEGRRERDLATRLGGEIARVRTLYEQRVSAEVRQSADYVHEELIRTLADGDASLLDVKA